MLAHAWRIAAGVSARIANLEHRHLKYALFRQPGDVHVHFFGRATLSINDDIVAQPGDMFEIEATPSLLPLRNGLALTKDDPVAMRPL